MKRHPKPEKMADDIATDAAELVSLLAEATSVQYERPVRNRVDYGTSVHGQNGEPVRPTEDTALDPDRLRLRNSVRGAAEALVRSHHDLYAARLRLLSSLEHWQGVE